MSDDLIRLAPAGCALSDDQLGELVAHYANPPRAYHTLDHIRAVAGHYATVAAGPGWQEPEAVYLAVLAHDAVYEVARPDNEARSAALATRWAERWWGRADWGRRAAALIEATAAHHALPVGEDADLDHFLDCDLAVLGAADEIYDRYAAGVAVEYAPVAGAAYPDARAAFLERLLAQPSLFRSTWFQQRLEAGARRNLLRELQSLS